MPKISSLESLSKSFEVSASSQASQTLNKVFGDPILSHQLKELEAWKKLSGSSVELRVNWKGRFYILDKTQNPILKFFIKFFSNEFYRHSSKEEVRKYIQGAMIGLFRYVKKVSEELKEEVKGIKIEKKEKKLKKAEKKLKSVSKSKKKKVKKEKKELKKTIKKLEKGIKPYKKDLQEHFKIAKAIGALVQEFALPMISFLKEDKALNAQFKDQKTVQAFSGQMNKIQKATKEVADSVKNFGKLAKAAKKHPFTKKDKLQKEIGNTVKVLDKNFGKSFLDPKKSFEI
ncbi:MAG: hypothetical protein ACM3JI_01705 [Anaerolineae bacterium]